MIKVKPISPEYIENKELSDELVDMETSIDDNVDLFKK